MVVVVGEGDGVDGLVVSGDQTLASEDLYYASALCFYASQGLRSRKAELTWKRLSYLTTEA